MAVPKTTEPKYRDGSVQARQVIKKLYKQPHPYIFLFFLPCVDVIYKVNKTFSKNVQGCRDGSAKNHSN